MNKAVRAWFENPETFLKRLAKGHEWEDLVAARLAAAGYEVEVPERTAYEGWKNAGKHANAHDLRCNGHVIEVKSRSLAFTCAADFPYGTLIVDTVQGFNQKVDKPLMYICISQKTGCMLGLDVKLTRELWTVRQAFDRTAKITSINFEADKNLWGDALEILGGLIPLVGKP